MSALIGPNNDGKPGLIVFMPEGKGEEQYDAKSSDVIAQGTLCFNDSENATPADRVYKACGTAGAEYGEYIVSTKPKLAGETKITGVGSGFEVTILADGTIAPRAKLIPGTVTAGRAKDAVETGTPSAAQLIWGQYRRLYAYANMGDGRNPVVAATVGQLIVAKIY